MAKQGVSSAIETFFQWEDNAKVEVVASLRTEEKRHFLSLQAVHAYFTADNCKELNRILTDVFRMEYPPVDSDLVLREHTAIFCVLLRLGHGDQIEHFARYEELSDRRLPFDQTHPPREFPSIGNDDTFLSRFCDIQLAYCAPILDSHMLHKHFGQQRILPIQSCRSHGPINQFVITLYGPYSKFLPYGTERNIYSDTFILKTYAKDNERQYKQEIDGFRNVRRAESIVKFCGSYIHGDEYNVLLEYNDKGTLEEYFTRETPPSRGPEIVKFWECLFLLINGLKAIHAVRTGHHNVTPEAIAVISNGAENPSDWQFKFSNVGVNATQAPATEDKITDTATYAPPESYTPSHDDHIDTKSSKSNWSADIWALGCIFSEAAIWIADGYKGLIEYRQQRASETDRILFKGSDCFHDGQSALQCVLNAHADIEDRLRRSDNITKDVLDTMVEEMLWEDDRPNAKALWRKSEMLLARARQRSTANSADNHSKTGSDRSYAISQPRTAPPTIPLPPIPRGAQQNLSSISEVQYPPNVDRWRAGVAPIPARLHGPPASVSGSEMASPTFLRRQTYGTESVISDSDKHDTGSVASWNFRDNASSITSPTSRFSSPRVSSHPDYNKQIPNEGRPRAVPPFPRATSRPNPYPGTSTEDSAFPPPLSEHPAYSHVPIAPVAASAWTIDPLPTDNRPLQPTRLYDEPQPIVPVNRANSSRQSTASSQQSDPPLRPKSSKRNGGFSLFPTRKWSSAHSRRSDDKEPDHDSVPRSATRSSMSSSAPSVPPLPDQLSMTAGFEYLSINTCIEWKKTQKKVKKNTKLPPLPGAHILEDLNTRDHVFIVDDSAAMTGVWPDLKRVFETLSYLVKGMSPGGTELYFTVSYDTYRRKDTTDLVTYVNNKVCKGTTDIAYRLNLEMQSYRLKLFKAKGAAVRPISFYLLTNGEWSENTDPKITVKTMADYLVKEGYTDKSQVAIQFVSFATTAAAMGKVNEFAQMDFGLDIVDCTRWTGNVLKMLKGAIDKSLFDHENAGTTEADITPGLDAVEMTGRLVYARDVINELA